MNAQNAMFIPFGQSRAEVLSFLKGRRYQGKVEVLDEGLQIKARYNQQETTYFFDGDLLYAIASSRTYTDKKEFQAVQKSCLDYLKMLNEKLSTFSSYDASGHYAVLTEDRIMEYRSTITEAADKSKMYTVELKSISREHGPKLKTASYAAKISANL